MEKPNQIIVNQVIFSRFKIKIIEDIMLIFSLVNLNFNLNLNFVVISQYRKNYRNETLPQLHQISIWPSSKHETNVSNTCQIKASPQTNAVQIKSDKSQ